MRVRLSVNDPFIGATADLRPREKCSVERSFAHEIESLKLGDGDIFHGEGILAVTRALLQAGVSCVGRYQGAAVDLRNPQALHAMTEASRRLALSGGVAGDDAYRLRRAIAAALADERHSALDTALRAQDTSGGVAVTFTPPRREPANVH